MRFLRLTTAIVALFATAACATQSALAPQPAATGSASATIAAPAQLPLLYVVDGVRYPLDRVPDLDAAQVSSVKVIKGRAALLKYGPEASYGVVLVTTKKVAASTR